MNIKYGRMRCLCDTKERFEQYNPLLMDGEIGVERQNENKFMIKIGDGKTPWLLLPYFGGGIVDATIDDNFHLILTLDTGKVVDVGEMRTDLSNYYNRQETDELLDEKVDKIDGKGLSANDYTDEDRDKLSKIEDEANKYIHPTYDTYENGLYKITVDDKGHISLAELVTDKDIENLGVKITDNDTLFRISKVDSDDYAAVYKMQKKSIDDEDFVDLLDSEPINIPKDIMLKSTKLKQCEVDGVPEGCVVGDYYIEMTMSNGDVLVLNAKSLMDIYLPATQTEDGLMSASDKIKLDGIEDGSEVNQNAFSSFKVDDEPLVLSKNKTDTFYVVSGDNITVTSDGETNTITISAKDTTYEDATQETSGLMSASDKTKLDGIEDGSEVNQNAFSIITVGTVDIEADDKTDKITFTAGDNVTLTPSISSKNINISAKDTTYEDATQDTSGLMSAEDKTKLDGISEGANNYVHPNVDEANNQGFYKITTNITGHVIKVTPVEKSDIVNLGIQESISYRIVKDISDTNYAATYRLQKKTSDDEDFVDISDSSLINIPKDIMLKSGLLKKCTEDNTPTGFKVGDMYIELILSNDDIINIPVNGLVDTAYDNTNSELSATTVQDAITELSNEKVDKIDGKGLSTNDYTNDDRDKLKGIATGAEVNQNAFSSFGVDSTIITSTNSTDVFYIISGDNITLTPNKSGKSFTITAKDTTYEDMVGASVTDGGKSGLVPAPTSGDINLYLRGDGKWAKPTDTTYNNATQETSGLMSASDKTKLDGIEDGSEVNQNAFSIIKVDDTDLAANDKTDTIIITSGDNITLTPDESNGSFTISAKDTTYNNATQDTSGLMSASDKTKLDGIESIVEDKLAVATLNISNIYNGYNANTGEYNVDSYFLTSRTGEIYGTEFYDYSINPTSIGIRLDKSIGKVCIPSTATVRNRNDFETIPLFRSFDVNAYVDEDGIYHITAIKGDTRFSSTGSNGDVYVMVMAGYVKYEKLSSTWRIYYSDTQHEGFIPLPGSKRIDGTMRQCMLYAKYPLTLYNAGSNIGSVSGAIPLSNASIGNYIDTIHSIKGNQYCAKTNHDDFYVRLMLWIKYATLNSDTILKGNNNYNVQSKITVASTNSNYVVISNTDAAKLVIGSSIDIGTSTDRSVSTSHSLANNYIVTSIEPHDTNNSRIILSLPNGNVSLTTTTSHYLNTTVYRTGWNDNILGSDGSRIDFNAMNAPFNISGIEVLYGLSESLCNQVIYRTYENNTDKLEVYYCNDMNDVDYNSIASSDKWIKYPVSLSLSGEEGYSYIRDINIDTSNISVALPKNVSGTSSTGIGDALYRFNLSTGWYSWVSYGMLSEQSYGGLSCTAIGVPLTSGIWYNTTRISTTGQSS
jgi:hypothetical protein